jgi:predicted component of viral defense system (DUF524 family)
MSDDLILNILKQLQKGQSDMQHEMTSIQVQLSAINERQGAQLTAELGMRTELNEIKSRIQKIEQRLELVDHT